MKGARILAVDDDPAILRSVRRGLEAKGYDVAVAATLAEGRGQLAAFDAEVILLDALYGRQAEFEQFIDSGKRAGAHKLIIVAAGTVDQARSFAKKFRYAAVREKIPDSYAGLTKREKRSKLLYLRSQFGHTEIVSGGKVIPLVLRLTPLPLL